MGKWNKKKESQLPVGNSKAQEDADVKAGYEQGVDKEKLAELEKSMEKFDAVDKNEGIEIGSTPSASINIPGPTASTYDVAKASLTRESHNQHPKFDKFKKEKGEK